ncbi:DUF1360 domain-containing protein [Neoroseomonas soli]|uniref:DUF1360 domain-containing protein n=1 Tax=Neoroseomonas soli TaxID=1081025 RepID=A0A9X9WTK9_9PROT|nr:DUF1360 domain-containing protein [Neoroseomonas soli]MBR0670488.1 DUF1360 domain-containing protein [Neoroseomonas soli]
MVDDPWFRFVLGVFATWRVAHLLTHEDGPWDLVVRLRAAAGNGAIGHMLDCFHCLSLWIGAPIAFAVAGDPIGQALAWLALSGAACLLQRLAPAPVALIRSAPGEGDDDDLLRTETRGVGER